MDAIVIGTGFGGLGAALTLAKAGAEVLVLESLNYPGGCAGTFSRSGRRFDAGATVAAGFGKGQLFRQWMDELGLKVDPVALVSAVELRAEGLALTIPSDRSAFAAQLAQLPGAPPGIHDFIVQQGRVADALWPLFADPDLLPPLSLASLAKHAGRAGSYLPVVATLGRTVEGVMRKCGVADFFPLRLAVDAGLQITVQTDATHADATFGLSAMDFWFREPVHIRGGMGNLADALVEGIRGLGGTVSFADRAKEIHRDGAHWIVRHRHGRTRAPLVIANLLPSALSSLLPAPLPMLSSLQKQVVRGWGAVAWFLVIRGQHLPPEAFHLQLVLDATAPLTDGNHVLVSISAADEVERAGPGLRVVTATTHVRLPASPSDIERVQTLMRRTLDLRAPELIIVEALPASPRTYARFTGRPEGWVGGPPRERGLSNYTAAFPRPVAEGLYLVGDSTFPGQSTLATAVGGHRVATLALRAGLMH